MVDSHTDCAIIGSGIFGSIIAKNLHSYGMNIRIVDDNKPSSGSKPAACLMKPSWYSSMGRDAWGPAMQKLKELYNVQQIEFKAGIKNVKVDWIDPKSILTGDVLNKEINYVDYADGNWQLWSPSSAAPILFCRTVILAAGIWCNKILKYSGLPEVPELSPRTGTSFGVQGIINKPLIYPYAPYRQLVAFQIEEYKIWIGDGTANKHYSDEHLKKSRERCARLLEAPPEVLSPTTGHRPYVKNAKPCYLKEHAPGLWVVTGGAKNGTIAAGWAAHQLGMALC